MKNGKLKFHPATRVQSIDETVQRCVEAGYDEAMCRKVAEEEATRQLYLSECGTYQVSIAMNVINGFQTRMTHLSIKRVDRQPIHDWRDLQEIKNIFVGRECEAIELYPAESRRVDSANQYHLWCFPDPEDRLPFGFNERLVTDKPFEGAEQRKLETEP